MDFSARLNSLKNIFQLEVDFCPIQEEPKVKKNIPEIFMPSFFRERKMIKLTKLPTSSISLPRVMQIIIKSYGMIPVFRPSMGDDEINAVADVLSATARHDTI
jgi:hypothetical protein